jgi:hypothetical protein
MSGAGSAIPLKGTFGPADPVVQPATHQAVLAAGGEGDTVAKVTEAGVGTTAKQVAQLARGVEAPPGG